MRNLPDIEYARSIQFKPKRIGTASITFDADEIDGFFIYPNLYFKAFPSPMPKDSLSHIFMERLFHGRLSMYLLDLSSIPLYFVQKSGGPLIQLVEKKNSHRELLKNLTIDCEVGIFPETFPLTSGSLIRFARRYEVEMQKLKVQILTVTLRVVP